MRTAIKITSSLLILFSTTFGQFGQGHAATLAGNLTPSATGTADSSWEGQVGAENFILAQVSTINQLGFVAWYQNDIGSNLSAALNSIQWYLFNDTNPASGVFGTPNGVTGFASGSVLSASATITNLGGAPPAPNLYDAYHVVFSIPDTVVGAGDYWVGFQITRNGGFGQIYWAEAASGDGISAILGVGWTTPYAPGVMSNAVFEVNGQLDAVPLPAALPLFASGAGLLGYMGWRRRKRLAQATA